MLCRVSRLLFLCGLVVVAHGSANCEEMWWNVQVWLFTVWTGYNSTVELVEWASFVWKQDKGDARSRGLTEILYRTQQVNIDWRECWYVPRSDRLWHVQKLFKLSSIGSKRDPMHVTGLGGEGGYGQQEEHLTSTVTSHSYRYHGL